MIFDIKEIGQIDAADLGPFGVAGLSRMDTSRLARRTHRWPKMDTAALSQGPIWVSQKLGCVLGRIKDVQN